jgi:hypothetical protein
MVTDRLAAGIGDDCDRCAAQMPTQFTTCRLVVAATKPRSAKLVVACVPA